MPEVGNGRNVCVGGCLSPTSSLHVPMDVSLPIEDVFGQRPSWADRNHGRTPTYIIRSAYVKALSTIVHVVALFRVGPVNSCGLSVPLIQGRVPGAQG